MRDSSRFRVIAVLVTLVVGALSAALLTTTGPSTLSDSPGLHVPQLDTDLGSYPELSSDERREPGGFFTPPNPLPQLLAGSVLKVEPIKEAPAGIVAYRVMYMSTRVNGDPVAVTAAFFDRAEPNPTNGRPLVGFAHGTVGLGRYCGVSQAPFTEGMSGFLFWISQIQPLVDAGYAVVATDFQDMGAPGTPSYLVAQSEAYSVLDSMRAAVTQFPDRVDANRQILNGHSQGGQASLAAAAYWQDYAPDLAIRGVVSQAPGIIIGLPIVAKQLVSSTTGKSASGRGEFLTYLTKAWTDTYPDQLKPSDVLTPEGMAKLPLAGKLCGGAMADHFDQPLSAYVKSELPPALVNVLNQNVPVRPISMPILFTQGLDDTTIVPQFTMAAFKAMCQYGSTVELQEYRDTTHTELLLSARVPVVDWMNDRIAGEPAPSNCAEHH